MDLSQDSSITNITNCCNQPLQSLGPTNWPAIIRRRSKGSRSDDPPVARLLPGRDRPHFANPKSLWLTL